MGPAREGKKGHNAHQILTQPKGLCPRKKDKEFDLLRSPRSKHPLRILKQANGTTRQETEGGGRDKKARKKGNI